MTFLNIIYLKNNNRKKNFTVPSANADITLPSAESDLLIFFASSRTVPSAPVLLT